MLILPKNDLLKQEVLEKVIIKFEKGRKYKDNEVKEIILSCDVEDYVLFRRELINFGYMGRDMGGNEYWVIKHKLSDDDLKRIAQIRLI